MAITFIYAIKVNGQVSLKYDTSDKDCKIDTKLDDSMKSLNYIVRDKKGNKYSLSEEYLNKMADYITKDKNGFITFRTITNSLNCSVENAYAEWEYVRKISRTGNGKTGNLQYCIVQNFGTYIDPLLANKIGMEFAQKYLSRYQCVVSTHINTGYVHNHIEFNATSFIDGKKFNDNLKVIGEIRKISDDLCRKYELEVLDRTKEFRYVMFRDSNGKIQFYEPTDRKKIHNEGEFANKNDYRNTLYYSAEKEFKQSHVDMIKNDIEKIIPYVDSYEELLEQLRNCGYSIKDKTKKDEWRQYISFKAPSWDKYVRDKSIGEEYLRENLTRRIEEQNKKAEEPEESWEKKNNKNINQFYEYGKINIEDMDEEFSDRKKREQNENDIYEKHKRTSIEKFLVREIKYLNKEIELSKKQALYVRNEKIQQLEEATKREQYLVDRINSNLRTLHFVENKNLTSINQINSITISLYEKRNECNKQLEKIGNALKLANANIVIIDRYNELKKAINNNSEDYILYEKQNDLELLRNYEMILKGKELLSESKQLVYKEQYQKYYDTYDKLLAAMKNLNIRIKEYDDCIFNLSIVDKKYGNVNESEIKHFYDIKEDYKLEEQKER